MNMEKKKTHRGGQEQRGSELSQIDHILGIFIPFEPQGQNCQKFVFCKKGKKQCKYTSTHNANKKRLRGDGAWVFD